MHTFLHFKNLLSENVSQGPCLPVIPVSQVVVRILFSGLTCTNLAVTPGAIKGQLQPLGVSVNKPHMPYMRKET